MSNHRAAHASRVRNIGRASAVVAGSALALSGIAAGTANADEGYGAAEAGEPTLTLTTPVDGVVYHWYKYHYGEGNFLANEAGRIGSDPVRYAGIHLEMVGQMLGLSAPHGAPMGSDY